MPTPNAKSGAEYRLERIHSDDKDIPTAEERHDMTIKSSEALAGLIAHHPHMGMSKAEVLEAAEYRYEELRGFAAELFPDRFGGDADV